ncbi:sulfatase [Bacteroides sp. 51]|uniref:sulfatase family protein n=1 Tax=Bacteroides sp. 51 TaxID=2302938 RepID=UPI0013D787F5|nr:sulfatase [Bacteroides sp. 51]NDV81748.1 DUF4976 domain-containing protein [Bacteroides sp. 51]
MRSLHTKKILFPSLALTALCSAAGAQTPQRPNVVLVIADDCRMLDLGCYGSPDAITPNIDRLATEGLKFNNFFQATAMSSPTRHCLLTGQYPVRSGAYPNHTFINEGVKTLPHYLKENGYRVAQQGKRHFNPLSSFPFEYLDGKEEKKLKDINPELIESFLADASSSQTPFFLYLASNDPHSPWTRGDRSLFDAKKLSLPPTLVDTEETREEYVKYLAEINQLDSDVGKIDRLIEKYGLKDNTIFIFTSEQGHSFPFAKWTCYSAGLQTGFIIRWNGVVKAGTETNAMCEYVDVTPTIMDMIGGKIPKEVDGKSFLPVITQGKEKFKEYTYSIQTSRGIMAGPDHYGIRSVRDAQYRYILNLTPEMEFSCHSTRKKDLVWASWQKKAKQEEFARERVTAYQERPAEELYDIINDPFEMHNLAQDPQYAAIKKSLQQKLKKWMKQQGDKGQSTEMDAFEHMWGKHKSAKQSQE